MGRSLPRGSSRLRSAQCRQYRHNSRQFDIRDRSTCRQDPAGRLRLSENGAGFGRDSSISSIKDLAGKKVAVNRGGTGEYLLMQGLATNGIDPKSVERVYLSPSDSGPSFVQGHVDAWATWDPFLTIAERAYDGKIVADGATIRSDNAVVLVASKEFAQSKLDQLQLVFDVIKSENAWAIANKPEAGAIWAKEMNVPADLAQKIGENNAVPTTAVSKADAEQIGKVAEWYAKNGIIPAAPDVASGVVTLK